MYVIAMSYSDISKQIEEIYSFKVSGAILSVVINRIISEVK